MKKRKGLTAETEFRDDGMVLPRVDPAADGVALPPTHCVRTLAHALGVDRGFPLDTAPFPACGFALHIDANGDVYAGVRSRSPDGVPIAILLKNKKQCRELGAWLTALGNDTEVTEPEVRG